MNESPASELGSAGKTFRDSLASIVVVLSLLVILALGIVVIAAEESSKVSDTTFKLLNILLPVMGVWMGTVMAFYFSKENYEAAARHALQASQGSVSTSPIVSTVMTPYKDMSRKEVTDGTDADELKLVDLFSGGFTAAAMVAPDASGRRLVIVREKTKQVIYVVHFQTIPLYLATLPVTVDRARLTLADIKKDNAAIFGRLQNWVAVGPNDKLEDAKFAMDGKSGCRDAFVTETGKPEAAVFGWITNVQIAQISKA